MTGEAAQSDSPVGAGANYDTSVTPHGACSLTGIHCVVDWPYYSGNVFAIL